MSHRPPRPFRNKKHSNKVRSHTKGVGKPHSKNHTRTALPETKWIEGVLQHKGKFGFVLSENPAIPDVMIQGPSLGLAMPNDRVQARVTSMIQGRLSGVITKVLERNQSTFVGIFKQMGNMAAAESEDRQTFVRIHDMNRLTPELGDMVVVKITRWPEKGKCASGILLEVLGHRDEPGVDFQTVLRKYGLSSHFPVEVENEASQYGSEVPDNAWKGTSRELFFDQRVFTIDGVDAKDFDDAVSIKQTPEGWELGVHIADVSHYVREDQPLDKEAEKRGTSVYLAGKVVPMLPFSLSDNLCSLRPNVVRLTLSCLMSINKEGDVHRYRVVESAIRSTRRFTYNEVEMVLKGENPPEIDLDLQKDILLMGELARLLRKKRFSRGSLDFDFPEENIITGLDGRPIDIKQRERLEAHRLIEDFMVLANETVATHMKKWPFLYRVHEAPDPTRVEKLRKSLDVLGVPLSQHKDFTKPSALASILSTTEGRPLQALVHLMVLRSLKQAIYSPLNKGHFGLASECYTHFTSPIRRYPDLLVHRLLRERIQGLDRKKHWYSLLPQRCEHASQRERNAVDAEREFMAIQKVRLMQSHVGETFGGSITSVTNFGLFIQLEEYFVEGLVHVTMLGNDYYIFNEHRMTLTGRRTGRQYAIGQKVKVLLAAANIEKRQLDFELVGEKVRRKNEG